MKNYSSKQAVQHAPKTSEHFFSKRDGLKSALCRKVRFSSSLLFVSLAILITNELSAQSTPTLLNPGNTFIQQRIEHSDPEGWLYFKNSSDLKAGDLFSQQKAAAGLSADDAMLLFETGQDEQGCTHNHYQQYYKNIKVEGGEFFEHLCGCYVSLMNGRIIEGLNFSAQPAYTEQQALTIALASVNANKYAWQDTLCEQGIKDDTENPNATYYPTGSLILTRPPGTAVVTANYQLTWRFEIAAIEPSSQKEIYVNANSGAIVKSENMSRDNGPAGTLYDGTKTIDTKWAGGLFHGHHHLIADENGKNVETRNGTYSSSLGWDNLTHVFDNDDTWGLDAPTVNTTSAHWVVSRSVDFYKDTYGRNGIKNKNNSRVRVFGNSTLANNAAYRKTLSNNPTFDYIEFGKTTSSNIYGLPVGVGYASLDIGGHEMTHGVTVNEANFTYEGESGALDESFADIFGIMVEKYARGGTSNWTIGEDLGVSIRDIQNPGSSFTPQPTTYLTDPLWISAVGCVPVDGLPPAVPTGNDRCGVHVNSGIQNRWFYLLSQGGTQSGVTVQGIGIDKAARIAYHNLCNFLGANSNHPQSRLGSISSARILYGACSNEEVQTTNAWAAVGVGAVFAGNCVTLTGKPFVCNDIAFFPFCYTAQGFSGANFTWSFPPEWSGTTSGTGNKYLCITSFGNFNPPGGFPATVTITATSSLGGSASMTVIVEKYCHPISGSGGERSPEKNLLTTDASKLSASIYPNPTTGRINVSCFGGNPQLISVFSSVGENLIEVAPSGSNLVLDVSTLPNGVYFVKVKFDNQTLTKKLSKIN
jgi:Zn-dependent metalloprotease